MRASTLGAAALMLGCSLFVSLPAFAGNEVAAEALFGEAKKLAAAGKYAEACPKFAESNRLDRGAGTMIHLGDCYEKNKQSASAWATYKEAASAAQAINRKDWEKLANDRAAALEKKLAHLTIKVEAANDRAEVTRDGTVISKAEWALPIPVDIGTHVVEAKQSGFKPFTTNVTVGKDGENVEVTVPPLEQDPTVRPPQVPDNQPPAATPQPVTEPPPDADKGGGSSQRTIGFIVGGLGVAGVALGAITGLMAIGKSNDAKDKCANDGACPDASAVDSANSAKTLATVSTIGFIAGGVALGAGAVLVFTAPSGNKTAVRVIPQAGPSSAGLTFSGAF
jgi:hypothetical protein